MSKASRAAYQKLVDSPSLKYGDYEVTKDWMFSTNPLAGSAGKSKIIAFNPNDPTQRFGLSDANGAESQQLQEYLTLGGRAGSVGANELSKYYSDFSTEGNSQPNASGVGLRESIEKYFGDSLSDIAEQKRMKELSDRMSAGTLSVAEGNKLANTAQTPGKTVYETAYEQAKSQNQGGGSSSGSSKKDPNIDIPQNKYSTKTGKLNPAYKAPTAQSTPTFALTSGNLKSGASGTDVSNLQTLLGGLTVDGKYGPKTIAAVKAFQTANGLTADGIVGPNTVAMLNAKNGTGSSSNLSAPATGGVSNGVPGVSGTYTPPNTTAGTANNVYYQSLNQQVQTLQATLDKEYNRQLQTVQRDKERAQDELNSIRESEKDAIDETGKLAAQEKQDKLEQLEIEQKRFDENYNIVQGLGTQLTDLMTQGNALITEQKGVTGLGLIRNPRVTETINNITAAAGVINAGISVYNGQMNQAQNQLQTATSTITSAYGDQIDYYKSLANFYESMASDESQKLSTLTNTEQDFLQSKIASLESDVKRVKDTSQAIQNAMIDPDTALAYASAGVTLNDSPEAIAQKLAKYGYSKELSEQSNEMASSGYTALVSGSAPAGSSVVKITDSQGRVKTYYKKASGTGSGGNALSILDIQRYQEAFPNAGITAGDTEATANAKVNASSNPATQTKDLIQSIKDNGTSYNDVVKEINNDETITDKAGTIKIANEVYGVSTTTPAAAVKDETDWFDDIANYLFGENFKSNI